MLTDHRGEHEAPTRDDIAAPLHDLCVKGIYPPDVYSPVGFKYYGDNGDRGDAQAFALVMHYHNHPNRPITIYRAVPKTVKAKIGPGDWVTIVRSYAADHGRDNLKNDYRISTKQVYARDLFTEGNSLVEWGFAPQPFDSYNEHLRQERRKAKAMETTSSVLSRVQHYLEANTVDMHVLLRVATEVRDSLLRDYGNSLTDTCDLAVERAEIKLTELGISGKVFEGIYRTKWGRVGHQWIQIGVS